MHTTSSLTFKIASEPWEFEQVHKLNYKTFVEEIPQHEQNKAGVLVDRFNEENTYIICLDHKQLVGMMAVRAKRPFSLDEKLDNVDALLPSGRSVCEIRLLAVEKPYRNGYIFYKMTKLLVDYGISNGYDLAIISGTVREQKLYKHLGFVPFGPLVGDEEASFQPMYLTRENFERKATVFQRIKNKQKKNVSFLPGPVEMADKVREAFAESPVSHRSKSFTNDIQQIKQQLCTLTNARNVELFLGSGTLGNDVVAGQLSRLQAPGVILANGEFGERLVDHAERFGLSFHIVKIDWGEAFQPDDIISVLRRYPETSWLWAVHCETSTGVLNDLDMLKNICREHNLLLCTDCCSSLGTVPLDLEGVYLASSGSGKGLASFAGLSVVFYHHDVAPSDSLPRYLDLGLYRAKGGVPFTHSSNLVYALQNALKRFEKENVCQEIKECAVTLRAKLRDLGFEILNGSASMSPGIVTIVLSYDVPSETVGAALEKHGYYISYRSNYLLARNWIQISLMGDNNMGELEGLIQALSNVRSSLKRGMKTS